MNAALENYARDHPPACHLARRDFCSTSLPTARAATQPPVVLVLTESARPAARAVVRALAEPWHSPGIALVEPW